MLFSHVFLFYCLFNNTGLQLVKMDNSQSTVLDFYLEQTPKELQNQEEVLKAVEKNGITIEFASEKFQNPKRTSK
jgi:hypothetical protein